MTPWAGPYGGVARPTAIYHDGDIELAFERKGCRVSGPKGIDYYYNDGHPSLAGDSFVVIKASEGTSFPPDGPIPAWYAAEQARVRAAGDLFGAFLFWHPGQDNAAQVSNFVRRANLRPGDVVQLDMEVTDGLTWAQVSARKNDMQARLRAALPHCRVLTYTYLDFWAHVDHQLVDGLWIADPSAPAGAPRVSSWVIHQYGSGAVDYDVANFTDAAHLRAWAAGLIPTPAPTQETDMAKLFDVAPSGGDVPGIWYQDGPFYVHVVDPAQLAAFRGPAVQEGAISYAQHQANLAAVAALKGAAASVTVDASQLTAAVKSALADPGLLAAQGAAYAHAAEVARHNDTPAT